MKSTYSRASRRNRGSVTVLVTLGMVCMIGLVGVAVDFGYVAARKNQLQNYVDAKAVAALKEQFGSPPRTISAEDYLGALGTGTSAVAGGAHSSRHSAITRAITSAMADTPWYLRAWTVSRAAPSYTKGQRADSKAGLSRRQRPQTSPAPGIQQTGQRGGCARGVAARQSGHRKEPKEPQPTQRGGNTRSRVRLQAAVSSEDTPTRITPERPQVLEPVSDPPSRAAIGSSSGWITGSTVPPAVRRVPCRWSEVSCRTPPAGEGRWGKGAVLRRWSFGIVSLPARDAQRGLCRTSLPGPRRVE